MSELRPYFRKYNHTHFSCYKRRNINVRPTRPNSQAKQRTFTAATAPDIPAVARDGSSISFTGLKISNLYTSQTHTHNRTVGPVQLEVVPGKGIGWRAARDIATGELLIVSLPIAVLYGAPREPPRNEELAEVLRQSWPRLFPLERRWLLLLGDCCAASSRAPSVSLPERLLAASPAAEAKEPPALATAAEQAMALTSSLRCLRPQSESLLEELFLRARALLAEAEQLYLEGQVQQQQQAQQAETSLEPSVAKAVNSGPASPGSSDASIASTSPLGTSLQILPPALFGPASGTHQHSRSGDASDGGVVRELVQRYSYSETRDDPALTELLDIAPASCAGLWPEVALLNHSCYPNTSVLVVGGAAYVRAGRPVLEGEELTVSYLGRGVFADVAERRSRLWASHGFLCTCPRCAMEHEHFPTCRYPELKSRQQQQQYEGEGRLREQSQDPSSFSNGSSGAALDDTLMASKLMGRRGNGPLQTILDTVFGSGRFRTSVAPDHGLLRRMNKVLVSELEAAVQATLTAASRPRQQQAALLERLDELLEEIERACTFLELPPRGRLLAFGSVYGLVRLANELAELSQQATPERRLELLQLAAEVTAAVAPGSDGHVTAAVKAAGAARRVHGAGSPVTRRAELMAATAHLARYGRELLYEPALLRRLTATRKRLSTGSGLAASMGVLAWLQHVGPG